MIEFYVGNFIKCEIMTSHREKAHQGPIHVILYVPEQNEIITAGRRAYIYIYIYISPMVSMPLGADGMIKWWHFPDIDQADVKEDDTVAMITPKEEFQCMPYSNPQRADIRNIILDKDDASSSFSSSYLIQDGHGLLFRLNVATKEIFPVMEHHAGAITGLGTSPLAHIATTCGVDGTLRTWDYVSGKLLFSQSFSTPATALIYAPLTHDATGQTIAVAFQDGVVRILEMSMSHPQQDHDLHGHWHRRHVFKPHHEPITTLAYAPNGAYLATASTDQTLFLFKTPWYKSLDLQTMSMRIVRCFDSIYLHVLVHIHVSCSDGAYEPLGFKAFFDKDNDSSRSPVIVEHISWRWDSKAILVTCSNGLVGYYSPPEIYIYISCLLDTNQTHSLDIHASRGSGVFFVFCIVYNQG
jgi:WD40 repeat protein